MPIPAVRINNRENANIQENDVLDEGRQEYRLGLQERQHIQNRYFRV